MEAFGDHDVFIVTYASQRAEALARSYTTYCLENIGKSPLRMLAAIPKVVRILMSERPDIVASTGAEIAIPFIYLGKALRMKTIFIESWTCVKSPSLSGKLVYPVADVFLVQWEALLEHYGPKARFEGALL